MNNLIWDCALNLLLLQGLLGAFDTIYHHELTVGLPQRPSARLELRIHALRAWLYGGVFAAMAWLQLHGSWAAVLAAVVLAEVGLTLWDFLVEDASRRLPGTERVLHTVLAINGGALFGLYGWQLLQWWSLPTAVLPLAPDWRTWALTAMALGVAASGLRDALASRQLGRRPVVPNPYAGLAHRRILLSGGTGFIGEVLVGQLIAAGHAVTILARDPLKAAAQSQGRARCVASVDELHAAERFDAVINLAGAPVVGPRWSTKRKAQLLGSRLGTTEALLGWLRRAEHKPALWLQASAIGYYGVRPAEEALDEMSDSGEGFMSELCARWEASANEASQHGVRLVTLRLGLVLGHGGALPSLLLPFRLGLGGRMGSGQQVMSWIHLEDLLALLARCLVDGSMRGTYNAVAPGALSQAEFAAEAGLVLGRPAWLPLPAAPLRALLGEMAQLFVDGQRVLPRRLQAAGFVYRYPAMHAALQDLH